MSRFLYYISFSLFINMNCLQAYGEDARIRERCNADRAMAFQQIDSEISRLPGEIAKAVQGQEEQPVVLSQTAEKVLASNYANKSKIRVLINLLRESTVRNSNAEAISRLSREKNLVAWIRLIERNPDLIEKEDMERLAGVARQGASPLIRGVALMGYRALASLTSSLEYSKNFQSLAREFSKKGNEDKEIINLASRLLSQGSAHKSFAQLYNEATISARLRPGNPPILAERFREQSELFDRKWFPHLACEELPDPPNSARPPIAQHGVLKPAESNLPNLLRLIGGGDFSKPDIETAE